MLGGLVGEDAGTYKSSVDESVRHALDVGSRLCVGEGLVGDALLQAVEVGDGTGALGGSGVAEQREDGVYDVVDVVQLESGLGAGQELSVGELLWFGVSLGTTPSSARLSGRFDLRGTSRLNLNLAEAWSGLARMSGRAAAMPSRTEMVAMVWYFILSVGEGR